MKQKLLTLVLLLCSVPVFAQADKVAVVSNDQGTKLVVNGQDFMINGMNWDYYPIGTNYSYSLWKQPESVIKTALDDEMGLLKNMGVNAIRVYTGIPAKWIEYIYDNYGIYTMLNHTFGRYGLDIDGAYIVNTDYADPRVRKILIQQATEMAAKYKNTRGILLFLLGNENNYGLFWEGAETEDIPMEDRKSTKHAYPMYKLFNDAAISMKKLGLNQPVGLCNGDALFIDIIAKECNDIDIFGVNSYRGTTFTDIFKVTKAKLKQPIMFTEFGADAFNVKQNAEDQQSQAYYLLHNWHDIYENAAGQNGADNCIGGFTFQFSDGWWKYGQTEGLSKHDDNASWSNGGYFRDYTSGKNNMNEEWFGICAKGPTNAAGNYPLYPRAAYFTLKQVHQINPYQQGITPKVLDSHFASIQLMDGVMAGRAQKAAMETNIMKKVRLAGVRAEFETYYTGGHNITTPENVTDKYAGAYPKEQGFDHTESYYFDVEANPTSNVSAKVSVNVLGHVAENPIDEIFYENRGRTQYVKSASTAEGGDGVYAIEDAKRVQVYSAEFNWNEDWFDLTGFYRTGHYHWGYEGDFFGLYPEANYGPNMDIYNGAAPFGVEVDGKKALKGLSVAFGPELWWGANPAVLVKYNRNFGKFNVAGIFHEDLDDPGEAVSSIAIPTQKNRRASLAISRKFGKFGIQLGGLWSGQPRVGDTFQQTSGGNVYIDEIEDKDTWGGKAKITYTGGQFNWYAQGALNGLVASGGADYTQTYTGWKLKDSGSSNQMNFLTGFTYRINEVFEIAPNMLWQMPLVGAVDNDIYGANSRNVLDDPFAVRANRKQLAGELLLTYDPTPGTWMYAWDSDEKEDAKFAANLGFVYRHISSQMDAGIGISADGRSTFAFAGAPDPHDLWEANARIVSKVTPNFGIIANVFAGDGQSNGSDSRMIHRYGGDVRVLYNRIKLTGSVKINDWGPYDYHRDYNLTYPVQTMLDLSTTLSKPKWWVLPQTRMGIRGTWRSLNKYSPRYSPAEAPDGLGNWEAYPDMPGADYGNEWEIRTYIHFNIGN